jgi:hypothetical protein
MAQLHTFVGTRDRPPRSRSTRVPETLYPSKIDLRAFATSRKNRLVGSRVSARFWVSTSFPRSGTLVRLVWHRGQGHWPRFLIVAMRIPQDVFELMKGMHGATNLLLRIIGRVAIEPRKDSASDTIWELDEDSMLVRICKPSLEDELDDLMEQLPSTVRVDIRWGRYTERMHVCICKVVWKLGGDKVTWIR